MLALAVWNLPTERLKTGSETWQKAWHEGQLDKKEGGYMGVTQEGRELYESDTGGKESCGSDTGRKGVI